MKTSLFTTIEESTGNIRSAFFPFICHGEVERYIYKNRKLPDGHLQNLCFYFAKQGVKVRLK